MQVNKVANIGKGRIYVEMELGKIICQSKATHERRYLHEVLQ